MTSNLQSTIETSSLRASRVDYSLRGETLLISRLLPSSGSRLLVDVGAGDGVTWSVSRGLLDEGWAALLLEDDPKQFEQLTMNMRGVAGVRCAPVTGDGALAQFEAILIRHQIPSDFQLLLLNSAEAARDVLGGFDTRAYHPTLIAVRDPDGSPEARSLIYRRLNQLGYSYAGLAETYSLWSVAPIHYRDYPACALTTLPPLASDVPTRAYIDTVPLALGSSGATAEATYLINGWAFTELPYQIPSSVYLEVRDARTGTTDYFEAHRCHRPDVSAHFRQPFLAMSGFRALITIRNHMAGPSLSIRVVQMDAERSYTPSAELVIHRSVEDYEPLTRIGLAQKFLSGAGIEIGALQRPLSLPPSCRVRYVDRMSLSDLLHHYPELKGLPIQAPDLIDNGELLAMIADNSQDFVIANHLFEHAEDPFKTLSTFLRVLRVGGILYMAVPDKRFTFDFDRPCTEYPVLRETYLSGRRADHDELFYEWVRHVQGVSGQECESRAAQLLAENYSIHYNVWTVDELLTQLIQARQEFALPFRLLSAVCSENEAILLIEKSDLRTA